jgi:hypothetical protein
MITDMSNEIWDHKNTLKYARLYLREKPKDISKMVLEAIALENLWNIDEAISAYKIILDLQPYNSEIIDRLKRLENNWEVEETMEMSENMEEENQQQ